MNIFDFRTELGKMSPRIALGAKIYVWGTGANWEHICKMYKYLVNIDIDDYIEGFIDSDQNKQGKIFHNKQVYALSEINTANAVILISIVSWHANKDVLRQLLNYEIYSDSSVFCLGWDMCILMRFNYNRFLQLKDKHKGERCFIIGNGPSLLASDLDKLKNEITFATNKIFLIFDKTEWRPSYYCNHDDEVFKDAYAEIQKNIKCPAFYELPSIFSVDDFCLTNFYFYCSDKRVCWRPNRKPSFSEEPFVMQWGATITYDCLQLAAYMGFSEIYLLGVDNTNMPVVKLNGEIFFGDTKDHFDNRYKPSQIYTIPIDIINSAYNTAYEYCKSHNIKIYNATRGGALEAFERVDFDKLFLN